jgi:hypothetical protein
VAVLPLLLPLLVETTGHQVSDVAEIKKPINVRERPALRGLLCAFGCRARANDFSGIEALLQKKVAARLVTSQQTLHRIADKLTLKVSRMGPLLAAGALPTTYLD